MHGSAGVRLHSCMADPSGSRIGTRCIGVPVEQRRHSTNTQLFSSRCLARSCHTPPISQPCIAVNERVATVTTTTSTASTSEWLWVWPKMKRQQLRFPLDSTEALVHNHQGRFQWCTDVDEGEVSSESRPLREELEIWPNYGERDARMFIFKFRSRDTIQFISSDR